VVVVVVENRRPCAIFFIFAPPLFKWLINTKVNLFITGVTPKGSYIILRPSKRSRGALGQSRTPAYPLGPYNQLIVELNAVEAATERLLSRLGASADGRRWLEKGVGGGRGQLRDGAHLRLQGTVTKVRFPSKGLGERGAGIRA
jgi:hypothetical protein